MTRLNPIASGIAKAFTLIGMELHVEYAIDPVFKDDKGRDVEMTVLWATGTPIGYNGWVEH